MQEAVSAGFKIRLGTIRLAWIQDVSKGFSVSCIKYIYFTRLGSEKKRLILEHEG